RDKSLKADEPGEHADALAWRRRLVTHRRFFKRQLRADIHKPSRARAAWRREDLYTGSHIGEAPDIQFLPSDMTNKPLGTLDLTSNKFITPVYGNSGD